MRAPGTVAEPVAAATAATPLLGGAVAQARPEDGAAPHADDGGAVELVVENLRRESGFGVRKASCYG